MVEKLAAFITEHGFRAEVRNGQLFGEMAYSSTAGLSHEWEPVEPTLAAVREWLGY